MRVGLCFAATIAIAAGCASDPGMPPAGDYTGTFTLNQNGSSPSTEGEVLAALNTDQIGNTLQIYVSSGDCTLQREEMHGSTLTFSDGTCAMLGTVFTVETASGTLTPDELVIDLAGSDPNGFSAHYIGNRLYGH